MTKEIRPRTLKQHPRFVQRGKAGNSVVYRHRVIRVTAFGSSFEGDEQWSTGHYLGENAADVADPDQAAADFIRDTWQTFFTTATTSISSGFKCAGVRVTKYDTNGLMIPSLNFYSYYTVPISGGGSGSVHPAQVSLVASLQARPDRGLGAKGRMYLPGINTALATNGRITTAVAAAIALNLKNYFNTLNLSESVPGQVINASKGNGLFPDLTAVNRTVQDILVGNVFDTQRRRRNQLAEQFSTSVLVP